MTQPEALRLAEWLEGDGGGLTTLGDCAAELRRLSAENEMLWREREEPHKTIDMYVRECNRLESERDEARRTVREAHEAGTRVTAQRDALLEAIKPMIDLAEFWINHGHKGHMCEQEFKVWLALGHESDAMRNARAAIKQAEGEK